MKTLFRNNQRHRDLRETSDVTWRTSDLRRDNARIFSGLLDVCRSKKDVQEALDRLKRNPRTAKDGLLQQVIEKTRVLVEGLESVAPHYEKDLQTEDLRVLQKIDVVGVLRRLGCTPFIGARTESTLGNIAPLNNAIRNAESGPGSLKRWLRTLSGKTGEIQVPRELIELRMSVEKTEESLQRLSREIGLGQARREQVRQRPELQLAYEA